MRAIIVSGGTPPSKNILDLYLRKDDFIIGVDKGCNCLYDYSIIPNLILGDLDSANIEVIDYFKKNKVKILEFDVEKDYTDTDLGYCKAVENGVDEILLFGATGSRMDHVLGNIGVLLKALKEGIKIEIIDENNRIFLIDKGRKIEGKYGQIISFHAISEVVKNLSIINGKYELKNYDMTLLEPRAVCNEFLNESINISFDSGVIMVIFTKD